LHSRKALACNLCKQNASSRITQCGSQLLSTLCNCCKALRNTHLKSYSSSPHGCFTVILNSYRRWRLLTSSSVVFRMPMRIKLCWWKLAFHKNKHKGVKGNNVSSIFNCNEKFRLLKDIFVCYTAWQSDSLKLWNPGLWEPKHFPCFCTLAAQHQSSVVTDSGFNQYFLLLMWNQLSCCVKSFLLCLNLGLLTSWLGKIHYKLCSTCCDTHGQKTVMCCPNVLTKQWLHNLRMSPCWQQTEAICLLRTHFLKVAMIPLRLHHWKHSLLHSYLKTTLTVCSRL